MRESSYLELCVSVHISGVWIAAQNLESNVNTEHDLATTSLGIIYISFTLFSLMASPMVRMLVSKRALVLGTRGYWLFNCIEFDAVLVYNGTSFVVSWICCIYNLGWAGNISHFYSTQPCKRLPFT
ncbi:hypothetical protein AAC387_Pa03g2599 [Persea americana]